MVGRTLPAVKRRPRLETWATEVVFALESSLPISWSVVSIKLTATTRAIHIIVDLVIDKHMYSVSLSTSGDFASSQTRLVLVRLQIRLAESGWVGSL